MIEAAGVLISHTLFGRRDTHMPRKQWVFDPGSGEIPSGEFLGPPEEAFEASPMYLT